MVSVKINYDISKGKEDCGECYMNCPMEVFSVDGNKIIVSNEDECTGCGVCEDVCPTKAVKVVF